MTNHFKLPCSYAGGDAIDLHVVERCDDVTSGEVIMFIHGWLEHCGRYVELTDSFVGRMNTITFDLPGHGTSGGTRCKLDIMHISSIATIVDYCRTKYTKVHVCAHSIGGLLLVEYLNRYGYVGSSIFETVVLYNPYLGDPYTTIVPRSWARRGAPNGCANIGFTGVNTRNCFSNSCDGYNYKSDPLVFAGREKLTLSTCLSIITIIQNVNEIQFHKPITWIIGTKDRICKQSRYRKYIRDDDVVVRILNGAHRLHEDRMSKDEFYITLQCIFNSKIAIVK